MPQSIDGIIQRLVDRGGVDVSAQVEEPMRRRVAELMAPLKGQALCHDLAVQITTILSTDRMLLALQPPRFWIHFSDPDAAPAERFLGVVVTRAVSLELAILSAALFDIHPGGQANGAELSAYLTIDDAFCDRLLSPAEAEHLTRMLDAQVN
ncbi:hypothetical protein [Brevundimonas sp. PAMC22021]|uniref:hypothetical protein n=1 Tax=Brevundimonas sp. PAMC22021 TaxID=2861285 RepID=UPI001C6255D0|nr:hypothetical protein [Brevundimonas sp. PAMC22021]QYF87015.1 hypothetical protein KY493_00345 [Brevundimonas sp. PAMC22021]